MIKSLVQTRVELIADLMNILGVWQHLWCKLVFYFFLSMGLDKQMSTQMVPLDPSLDSHMFLYGDSACQVCRVCFANNRNVPLLHKQRE